MKKFKIYTLGCKVNQYDSGSLKKKFLERGLQEVKKDADLAVINTCAVTKTAIRKDNQMLALARKENPGAKILLMGCFPETYQDDARKLNADFLWGVGSIEKLTEEIIPKRAVNCQGEVVSSDRSRYFIKIQDGCEQFCTYCIIPYARGKIKSRSQEEVKKEVCLAVDKGFREIILTGIHLGLYGKEKGEPQLLPLLKKLVKIKNLGRIRLSSIEVTEVTDELIDFIAKEKKMCNHLHIPLQSGCDKILQRMNRPYDKKYFLARVNKFKKKIPLGALTTDVIVGFPGETKNDFKETRDFIKEIEFSKLHVFPFSAHERTAAAKMEEQIEKKEKTNRAETLRRLGENLEKEYVKKFKNKEVEVIVENYNKGGFTQGKAEQYFEVRFKKLSGMKTGDLIKIKKWKI